MFSVVVTVPVVVWHFDDDDAAVAGYFDFDRDTASVAPTSYARGTEVYAAPLVAAVGEKQLLFYLRGSFDFANIALIHCYLY
jgi:hypothetical protein